MANRQVKTVGILVARPGQEDTLAKLLFGMAPHCRAEPGNLRWDLWRDKADPSRFVIDELYTGDDAVAAHRETPHYKAYAKVVNDLAVRTAMLLDPADIG